MTTEKGSRAGEGAGADEKGSRLGEGAGAEDDHLDELSPPTPEELAAAEALRRALEGHEAAAPMADFARALRAAHSPADLPDATNERLIAQAVGRHAHVTSTRRVIRVTFRATAALAAAAAAAIVAGRWPGPESPPEQAPTDALVACHSTQSLFTEPFAATGGDSSRLDRIASARARDLRQNRFALWGVR